MGNDVYMAQARDRHIRRVVWLRAHYPNAFQLVYVEELAWDGRGEPALAEALAVRRLLTWVPEAYGEIRGG